MKPIAMPVLPFRDTIDLKPVAFEEESASLEYGARVLYDDITKVEVLCRGIYFSGLELCLADGKTERIGNYYDTGEPARTALVILRRKAPCAEFIGPPWIEQGWVPCMGFTYPGTGS